jgi:hypothetical protein
VRVPVQATGHAPAGRELEVDRQQLALGCAAVSRNVIRSPLAGLFNTCPG